MCCVILYCLSLFVCIQLYMYGVIQSSSWHSLLVFFSHTLSNSSLPMYMLIYMSSFFSYKIPGQRQVKVTDYKQLESDTSTNIEFNVVGQLQKWIRHPNKNKGFSLTLRSAFGVDEETRNFIDTPTPCHRQAGNSSSSRSSRDVAMSSSLSPSSSGRI